MSFYLCILALYQSLPRTCIPVHVVPVMHPFEIPIKQPPLAQRTRLDKMYELLVDRGIACPV